MVLAGCGAELEALPDAHLADAPRADAARSDALPTGEPPADPPPADLQAADTAWFAGGCFWCMEPPFDRLDGVLSTTSGFMGGTVANPTYQQVTAGGTGHIEVVQVVFEPARVSYERLLEVFWVNVDPLDDGGQFCDRGSIYRAAIFARGDAQVEAAQASVLALRQSGRFSDPIVTELRPAGPFYAAEEYHQDYYRKNPVRYRVYRTSCGRDGRLRQLWGADAG
ncbi:MAG: peptide-methionine (S)-S-oxide reductase [Gemmatimonadales bacterium]|nr:MAG: peptide-methionine (S)-S-oxide reductase [Gemmatimonadales bacterium]